MMMRVVAALAFLGGSYVAALSGPAPAKKMMKVFIDGEAGTTGLQVRERLATHPGVEVLSVPGSGEEARAARKDPETRRRLLNEADAAVLCLPDDAAVEAVSLLDPAAGTKVVDASTAHRVGKDGWVYGFPEMCEGQKDRIRAATLVANPGCYATGFISMARPLVDAGVLDPNARLCVSAISGYSGGGKQLTAVFEEQGAEPWGAYGFDLKHKHLPEMRAHGGLAAEPIFLPAVGKFAQGMVVSVMLHYDQHLCEGASADRIHAALAAHYDGDPFVSVKSMGVANCAEAGLLERGAFLEPCKLNGSNNLEIFVFANDDKKTAALCARLDNLGKGASGAAVQNLNLLLGLDEMAGLTLPA